MCAEADPEISVSLRLFTRHHISVPLTLPFPPLPLPLLTDCVPGAFKCFHAQPQPPPHTTPHLLCMVLAASPFLCHLLDCQYAQTTSPIAKRHEPGTNYAECVKFTSLEKLILTRILQESRSAERSNEETFLLFATQTHLAIVGLRHKRIKCYRSPMRTQTVCLAKQD